MIKKIMNYVCVCIVLFCLPLTASALSVGVGDYTGARSTVTGGLMATGGWSGDGNNGFELTWKITDNGSDFTYMYSLSGVGGENLSKDLSHFILQVSADATIEEFWEIEPSFGDGGLDTWGSQGNSNPGIPKDIYGFKWNASDDQATWTASFMTERAPVWGDFYAVDGKKPGAETYVYNVGFGTEPTAGPFTDWIARPNGTHSVPEPATMLLFGTGVIGLVGVARRRKKA